MKIRGSFIFLAAISFVFILNSNILADEPGWFIEEMKNHEAILDPGTTTYCDRNFMVENMGDEMAEVHVILGNGSNYAVDQIEPRKTRSYSLDGNYPQSGGWEGTRGVHIDEARIVNSTAGTSSLKIHCK